MGGVWVDHRRDCERPTSLLARLAAPVLGHRDRAYYRLRVGAESDFGRPSAESRELYRRYVLEKNGISGIVDVSDRRARRELTARPPRWRCAARSRPAPTRSPSTAARR
jgi:hypothetical protein